MATSKYPVGSTDSILEYASNSQQRTPAPEPPPPPPPADTTIGTVTVAGSEAVNESDVTTYTASNDGDAAGLTYAWAIQGGTGTSTTASCEVTWGSAGAGKVTCTISSSEDTVTDSPASGELDVVVAVLFKLTSIGSLSFGGPQNPTTGEDVSYTCNNDGDADGLSYDWAVTGGTINGSKTNKNVDITCGPAGTMQLMCQVTSSDPNCSDTPQQKQSNIPVAMPPASFGTATVTGMQQGFVGEVLEYTAAYDGDVKSPIYRWKINGPSGEIASKGGLSDNTCNVRLSSPGSFEVKCTFDADDFYVADRGKSASVNVQVIQTVEDPEES